MACKELGFKEERVIPIAQKILSINLITKAGTLVSVAFASKLTAFIISFTPIFAISPYADFGPMPFTVSSISKSFLREENEKRKEFLNLLL